MAVCNPSRMSIAVGVVGLLVAGGGTFIGGSGALTARGAAEKPDAQQPPARSSTPAPHLALVNEYCLSCHDEDHKKGGLALDAVAAHDVARHPEVWEKVVRKLRARQMPPIGKSRPDDATYDAVISSLEKSLDRAAAANPNPGRTATIRRLTRTEYQNAIRDLLALDVDVASLLPGRRVELWLRQRDGRRSVADAAGSLRLSGGEDQPAGGRTSQPLSGRRDDSGFHRTSRRRNTSMACRSARAAARLTPLHVSAGRRVRDPDPADARPRRARRGAERSPRARAAAGQGARAVVHGEAAAAGVGILRGLSTLPRKRRPAPQDPRSGERRSARARRGVSEEAVGAAGNRSSALPGPLQFLPASTRSSRPSTPSRSSDRMTQKVPATRPAAAGSSARSPGMGPTKTPPPKPILAALMRRAYRRPVTDADLQGPFALYRKARADGGLRRGHRDGPVGGAGQSAVPVPRRTRSRRHPAEHAVSHQRSRAGLAALVLPLEQHSGR